MSDSDSWNSSDEELLNDTTFDNVIVDKIIEQKEKQNHLQELISSLLKGNLLSHKDTETFISLCESTVGMFLGEASLLRLEPPLLMFGDLHGQFEDLVYFLNRYGCAPDRTLLFLGDYVDRGYYSVEILALLFALKQMYPNKVYILRGNHEERNMNSVGGFLHECVTKYSKKAWEAANEVLHALPLAAIIGDKIFCVHAGPSPELTSVKEIENVERPCEIPSTGLVCDLMWSDPNPDKNYGGGWIPNDQRQCSYFYGADVVHEFLDNNDLRLMIRAHQVAHKGYEWYSDRILTLFSAPKYCGVMDNDAAILEISGNLSIRFHTYTKVPEMKEKIPLHDILQMHAAKKAEISPSTSAEDEEEVDTLF